MEKLPMMQGGPRKEIFRLCLKEIKDKYFGNGLNDIIAEEYEFVGMIMAVFRHYSRALHCRASKGINEAWSL